VLTRKEKLMKRLGNVLIGFVLVALGLVFAYNAMYDPDINIFFDGWWTLFIIVPCVIGLVKGNDRKTCLIGLAIGVAFLLSERNVINSDLIIKLIFPAILIIIGVTVIFRDSIKTKINKEIKAISERDKKLNRQNRNHVSVFSGLDLHFNGESFYGNNMTAVFGGIDCDINGALINEDVVINANAIFGGVDIYVPQDVNVKVKSTSIFGGVYKSKRPKIENAPTVYVNAICIFGSIEVK
jgi:predicted membrane protein